MPIVFQRNKKMGNKFRFDVNIKTKLYNTINFQKLYI